MTCEKVICGICLVTPSSQTTSSFFGFGEFISALALLIIVYTITDVRYRFRVSIAPLSLSLFRLTFALIGIIGFGTLFTDVWLAEHWLVPESLITQAILRGILGGLFLSLAMTWMYYAFIKPPIFSEKNYKSFSDELYRVIVKGSDAELPVIANELARSAESLIKFSRNIQRWHQEDQKEAESNQQHVPDVSDYANEMLLLIGNRKLCRHIIASTPITAMIFFEAMAEHGKYHIPIGQFSKNISKEAILNKDSALYHEDEGYNSGLSGYIKPFSRRAIYGNHRLVEALHSQMGSPFDIGYEIVWEWDASQLETYSRVALIALESYLKSGSLLYGSYGFYKALKNIEDSCRDVYKLKDIDSDYYSTDIYRRLNVAVDFVKEAVELLDKQKHLQSTKLRIKNRMRDENIYDRIANLMFEIFLMSHQ